MLGGRDELLTIAAREAREAASAAERHVRVAASVPPMFGSYLPGAFDSSRGRQMMKQFRRQLAPVADIFGGETLGSIAEVMAFLDVFGDVAAELWVSVTLEDADADPENPRLRSGEPLLDLLHAVERHRHDALLFNCSQPEVMADAIRLARSTLTALPDSMARSNRLSGFMPTPFR